MEGKTVIEESLELIEELIDTLSENSDHEAKNFAERARGKYATGYTGGKDLSTDKVLDKVRSGEIKNASQFNRAVYKQTENDKERVYRNALKSAKRAKDDLNIRKISKMVDRAKDSYDNSDINKELKRKYHDVNPLRDEAFYKLPDREIRTLAGLDKDHHRKDEYRKAADDGEKRRSESNLSKPASNPKYSYHNYPFKQKDLNDGSYLKVYDGIKRHERKEAKKAKIKESLESLISSNLSESTKIEILESIKSYLVD